MSKRRKIVDDSAADASAEISTVYGDMITFVMVLFILLFVLSYNKEQDETFFTKMQIQFGGQKVEQRKMLTTEALFVSKLQGYIEKERLNEQAQILVDEQKIKITLFPSVLYDSGKAELKPAGRKVIDGLAEIIKDIKNPIIVEGHTDNIPIHNREFDNNWDLSFHRSYSIVKYLMTHWGFEPTQLSALGYGEYHPIAPNDTAANRARNRRIEVNIIRVARSK